MKNTMKACAYGIAVILSAASSAEPEPSMCQRLAGPVERIPAVDWIASIYDPMDKLWDGRAVSRAQHELSPVETQLVNDPALREDLSVPPNAMLSIERLEGTDIYRIDSFQGTANCQYMIFVEASPGKASRRFSAPFDASPCTTQNGRFGRAFGHPIFAVGGPVSMRELARHYTISEWRGNGKGWGQACQLKLEFNQRLKLSGSYCSSDVALCKEAARLAPALVAAYSRSSPLDPLAFANGRKPTQAMAERLSSKSSISTEFPTFGAAAKGANTPFLTAFSNSQEPARLALWIDGRWWLGVVGVAGIGWRESTTSLVVVSAVTDSGLVPAASFQVEKIPAGPASVHWH